MTTPTLQAPQAYVMPERPQIESDDERLNVGPVGWLSDDDDDDSLPDLSTDIEKGAAPIVEGAEESDLLEHLSEENRPADVDLSGESTQLLLIGVWNELRSWQKVPSPEVIAQAVGLAMARVRGEQGLKHPRDLAKEVRVRPQTFFRVLNIAEAEIARLGLADSLRESGNL